MSVKRTIRVNRVVNTTSGKNNQTATKRTVAKRTAISPRRVMQKRAGMKPLSITIHNIFKPVNNLSPQGGKARGFKRTGRTASTSTIQRPVRRSVTAPRPIRRSVATGKQLPTSFKSNRKSLRANRKAFRAQRRTLRSNRQRIKRKTIAGKTMRAVGRYNPGSIAFRGARRLFGRRRRKR